MIVSIHQPAYLPWLGYFHKIHCSDVFVYLDNVQFEKNSFINRNKIKTSQGSQWLTVPLHLRDHFNKAVKSIQIDNSKNWRSSHLKSIYLNYKKSPFFKEYFAFFEKIYSKEWNLLTDLNYEMLEYFLLQLKIETKIIKASELKTSQKKDKLVLEICNILKAKTYFSGTYGQDYLSVQDFNKQGIRVVFQDYASPEYAQRFGGFVPNLSIVDILFNQGPDSLKIIMKDNITKEQI